MIGSQIIDDDECLKLYPKILYISKMLLHYSYFSTQSIDLLSHAILGVTLKIDKEIFQYGRAKKEGLVMCTLTPLASKFLATINSKEREVHVMSLMKEIRRHFKAFHDEKCPYKNLLQER